MRFLMYEMGADADTAAPPSPELMAEMGRFMEEATRSGALLATGGLAPAAQGVRVRLSGEAVTVTDGPFAEAKELIGGFALIEARSVEEAIEWATRFRRIAGDGESHIRQVYGPEDFGPPR